jgi:tetratricopeptide (TPR) repeat protein
VADDARTIRIRCETWDQVESFYTEKVKGNTLVVKMPHKPPVGETVTVALGLPSGIVFAIDGQVSKIAPVSEGGKFPVAVRLLGLTPQVRSQLERLVAEARAGLAGLRKERAPTRPPPVPPAAPAPSAQASPAAPSSSEFTSDVEPRLEEISPEERPTFEQLEAMRRKMADQAAHEILGVPADADSTLVRRGWLALAKKLHPDAFGKQRSPGIRRLAAEVFLQAGRAYDRMRGPQPSAPAQAVRGPWLVDVVATAIAAPAPFREEPAAEYETVEVIRAPAPPNAADEFIDEVSFTTSVRMKALSAEELFDDPRTTPPPMAPPAAMPVTAAAVDGAQIAAAARDALDGGDYRAAAELYAQALRADPKNRALRALYHVAYGQALKQAGDGARAHIQFETALVHDRDCEEAKRALGQAVDKKSIFKKLFER